MENNKNDLDLEKILEQLQNLNPEITIYKNSIRDDLNIIFEKYEKIKNSDKIIDEEEEELNNPYQNYKYQIDHSFVAKMIYANKKYFNFIPRKIQIISIIYFLIKNEKEGLIQQINTGEGKSLIISFLAVYIAKKKK